MTDMSWMPRAAEVSQVLGPFNWVSRTGLVILFNAFFPLLCVVVFHQVICACVAWVLQPTLEYDLRS